MQELQLFSNVEFGEIRGMEIDGKPYVVANDVLKALGYAEGSWRTTLSRKCKGVTKCNGLKVNGIEINLIPEGDIYRLIFSSKLPSAQKFEEWVMDEVLPQIRKHGAYMTDNVLEQAISDPDFMIGLLENLKEEKEKRKLAEQRNQKLIHNNKTYTATEIAKELGFKSATALNKDLAEKKIQYKVNGTWVLCARYSELRYVDIKQTELENGNIIYNRRWTGEGRDWLINEIYAHNKELYRK